MTFIVNGSHWRFDHMNIDVAAKRIDAFLSFVNTSALRGESVLVGDDFQDRPMLGARTLWELFAPDCDLPLTGEDRQELAAWLAPGPYYADAEIWPDGADDPMVAIGTAPPFHNPDLAWVHHSVRMGMSMALATMEDPFVGETVSAAGAANVHFVSDEHSRRHFWRAMIVAEGDNAASLIRNAPHAYPDVHFVGDVIKDVNHLDGGYLALRNRIQAALAGLDDHGAWVFNEPPPAIVRGEGSPPDPRANPTNQLLQARFIGLGLIAAPENPNVFLDRACREARQVKIGEKTHTASGISNSNRIAIASMFMAPLTRRMERLLSA